MVMNEVAEGLMARLSFMKRKLNFKASRPQCLNNQDWAKLRTKLESTFGELGDMSKIANHETFVNSAGMTMTELHNFYFTVVDIAELRDTSHETILDIATSFRTLKVGRRRTQHSKRRRGNSPRMPQCGVGADSAATLIVAPRCLPPSPPSPPPARARALAFRIPPLAQR